MNSKIEISLIDHKSIEEFFLGNELLAVDIVRNALIQRKKGDVILPDKISQIFNEDTQERINCLPATLTSDKICGMKWVSVFPPNTEKGYLNVTGVILISELEHGYPIAFIDATYITAIRTAAIGTLAASYLAVTNPKTIGFIGAGQQARMHFRLMKKQFPTLQVCRVSAGYINSSEEFKKVKKAEFSDVEIEDCGNNYERAIRDADICVTATSTQNDLLKAAWIKDKAFYVHVGGWEDEYAVPRKACKIVCDEWECVKHRTQTISRMYKEGLLKDNDIYADLADIVVGEKDGRKPDDSFIYFNSVGMAYIDMAFGREVYKLLKDKSTKFEL